MIGSTRVSIAWALPLCAGFFFAGTTSAAEAVPPVGRLLVFLPEGVDWIALPLEGDDLPAVRSEFARRVFESRDLDHDGVLVGDEAKRLVVWFVRLSDRRMRFRLTLDERAASPPSPPSQPRRAQGGCAGHCAKCSSDSLTELTEVTSAECDVPETEFFASDDM